MKVLMRVLLFLFAILVTFLIVSSAIAGTYGKKFCDLKDFYCLQVSKTKVKINKESIKIYIVENLETGETKEFLDKPSWEELFPDENEREIVQKLNRMNINPGNADTIAVPCDMQGKDFMDFSPFDNEIEDTKKQVIYNPEFLAWGAYENGKLVRWGPGSAGKSYCKDIKRSCRTIVGEFKVIRKKDKDARSSKYPKGCRGSKCAPMPYFVLFHKAGYGFHAGSLPGKHASHGCIRVFYEDAKWLNEVFAEKGTKVIVKTYG